MRERDVQGKTVGHARAKGILARKLDFGEGWPDYLFLHAGNAMFIEFKATEGRLRPLQEHVHKQLRNSGFVVHVVNQVEVGLAIIDAFLKLPKRASPVVDYRSITKELCE
jgi:hypothetical protein